MLPVCLPQYEKGAGAQHIHTHTQTTLSTGQARDPDETREASCGRDGIVARCLVTWDRALNFNCVKRG